MDIIDNQQGTLNAYIAGIWDGEGSITLRREKSINQVQGAITMANTDIEIIQTTIDFFKINNINFHIFNRDRLKTGRKIQYQLTITSHRSKIKFIELLIPYLTKNKEYARLLKELCEYKLECYEKWKRNGGNGGKFQRKYYPLKFLKLPKSFISFEREQELLDKYKTLRDTSETTSQTIYKFNID